MGARGVIAAWVKKGAQMKWIDIPPVWLAWAAVCVWALARVQPETWAVDARAVWMVGTGLVGLGLALIVLAALEMARHRTTIIPHMSPGRLVTSGVFALSRNPIYLGDAIILAGLCLRWGAPVGLILVPGFIALITRRFIISEEARLQDGFGDEFDAYRSRTRRWV